MPKHTYEELTEKIKHLEEKLERVGRRERERAISELKWQWQTTFDAVGASICVLDPQWNILQCNQATLDLLQKPAQEIIDHKCFELVHDTVDPPRDCPVHRILETKKREIAVLKLRDRWIEVAADPILDDEGNLKGIIQVINDITAHRSAAESIKKGESTLTSIFRAAPTGIGMVIDRNIVRANKRLCEMTGYTRKELIGQNARLLYPTDEDYEYVGREKYAQISENGTGTVETRWRHKNGDVLDILLSSTPLNPENLSEGVTFTALDITERKRSERALAQFNSAVEASSDAIGMATAEGKHWYHNKAFLDLFGDLSNDPPVSIFVDQKQGRKIFNSVVAGNTWTGEVEMYDKNKQIIHILLRSYPVMDDQGKVTNFVGVHTDISERKHFEEELLRSEQRFRALAELLPQTVFEMDGRGHLTFVNNNGLEVFGYTRDDFEKGLNVVEMIAPDDREEAMVSIQSILKGESLSQGRRFSGRKKDGSTFPVIAYTSASTDADGTTGLRGIIIDITEQEKLIQERNELEEQYSQALKMEAVGRLAGGVAHDLNNMLSPVVGYGEMLLEDMPPGTENWEAVEQILGAGLRAKDMVRQLLAFSRKQALEMKPVDLYQVLSSFESLLDRILRDDIMLELKLSRGIPNIMADTGQIEQVIMNLAVNAQDAMPNGGKITIEAYWSDADEVDDDIKTVDTIDRFVVLTFRDTGQGMDAETQERIFDPYFTTKGQGKGTGLGLATVYGIIKQHNGSIRVSSEPHRGTVFQIFFPAAPVEIRQPAEAAEKPETFDGNESILIAEDNASVRRLAESILQKHGYSTIAVSGGRDYQSLLPKEHHFDLLLTDVVLEDTNGKELFNRVKRHFPVIKVLYMTGYTDDVIVHHGVLEEGIVFVQKPFSVIELLKKVRHVLDGDIMES